MFKRIALLSAICCLPLAFACEEVTTDSDPANSGGGKADELGCDEDLDALCSDEFGGGWSCRAVDDDQVQCCIGSTCDFTDLPDDRDPTAECPSVTFVTHAVHEDNNHVISNCHDADNGQFVAGECCAEQIEELTTITGCPEQVRFNGARSGKKRCVNDESGQFVPTSCCAPLCSSDAAFDENGSCRNTDSGQFDETICCHRNDNLEGADCSGAGWEQLAAGPREGGFACRNAAGRFALDVCCVELCAEAVSRNPSDFPASCEEAALAAAVGDECPADAGPNAAGICHDPGNGQFVKAVCCDFNGRIEGLDRRGSDECVDGRRTDCE